MEKRKEKSIKHSKGKSNKDTHMIGNHYLFTSVIVVFIITQVLLYSLNFNQWFFNDTRGLPGLNQNTEILTGDIFFTGDTSGKYGLVGCDRLGSISRRAKILKKFGDYLYLDFGNFTMDNPHMDKAAVPIILKAYRYMDLKVMNLTKRDLLNLVETDFDIIDTREQGPASNTRETNDEK